METAAPGLGGPGRSRSCCAIGTIAGHKSDERGLAMIALLVTVIIVTVISFSLVGLMGTDMTHASIQ